MKNFKHTFLFFTFLSFLGTVVFVALYSQLGNDVLYSLSITFGTVFYHFAMRLLVGLGINAAYHNDMDCNNPWFREKPFERKLYKRIKVRQWKDRVPTYNPASFTLETSSIKELIGATCQAETVHEIIVIFSFVPLLFTIPFGSFLVFLLTSLAAAAFDTVFIILQRYNRPRLVKLLKVQKQ